MEIIKFIGVLLLVIYFVDLAQPIQFIKKILNIHPTTKSESPTTHAIVKLVSCAKCSGFWIGLIIYHDIWMALIVSISSEILHRLSKKLLG